MGTLRCAGLLALTLGTPTSQLGAEPPQSGPEAPARTASPPMLFHWRQPSAKGQTGGSRQLMERMQVYLEANYPDVQPPRIFGTPFEDPWTFHWFTSFDDFDARYVFDMSMYKDEGWQALTEQASSTLPAEGASRERLFHLGGATPGGARMTFRWVRVTRSHPSKVELARRYARDVVEYLEATFEEIDASAYSADVDDPAVIYWLIDCRTLGTWASVRSELLGDDVYVELLGRAADLFQDDGPDETMLVDIELDPHKVDAYSMGRVLEQWGDREGAIQAYRRAVQIDPGDVSAYIALGDVLRGNTMFEGDAQGGLVAFRKALALEPRNTIALNGLGLCLWYLNDLEGAIATFRELLEIHPAHLPALFNLGNLLVGEGELEEAVEVFRRHLASGPSPGFAASSHEKIGGCLRDLGNLDGAIASYRAALETRPENPYLLFELGRTLSDNGEHAQAIEVLERSLELREDPDPACGFYLAIACEGQGRDDEGWDWYSRAAQWMEAQGEPSAELERLRAVAEGELQLRD